MANPGKDKLAFTENIKSQVSQIPLLPLDNYSILKRSCLKSEDLQSVSRGKSEGGQELQEWL